MEATPRDLKNFMLRNQNGNMKTNYSEKRAKEASHTLAAIVNIGAGCTAAFAVAPLVAIVDKAITANASGAEALFPCMLKEAKNLIRNPIAFVQTPACKWMLLVFAGTYSTANSVALTCDISDIDPFYPKAGFTGIANVGLNLVKDNAFAKMFSKGPPKPVPTHILGMFAVRDMMTMYGSFAMPAAYSLKLQEFGVEKTQAGAIAQLAAPLSMQFLNTPLHLFSLDLYNNPGKSWAERGSFVVNQYMNTVIARLLRTLPGFGIGGLLNSYMIKEGTTFVASLHGIEYTIPKVVYNIDEGMEGFNLADMIKGMRQLGMFQNMKRSEFLIMTLF